MRQSVSIAFYVHGDRNRKSDGAGATVWSVRTGPLQKAYCSYTGRHWTFMKT